MGNNSTRENKNASSSSVDMKVDVSFEKLIIPEKETEEQEYLREKIADALNIYNRSDGNEKKKIAPSIEDLIDRYNFVHSRNYSYSPYNISEFQENFFGYKLVRILTQENSGKELNMDCVALLEIGIRRVANSNTGELLMASELVSGEKYCSQDAFVRAAWIIGPGKNISNLVEKCRNDQLEFVSNYDIDFKYKFDQKVTEPNFGKRGKGCVQGIHFFINKKSALKYIRTGFTSIYTKCLTVSCGMDIGDVYEDVCNNAKKIDEINAIAQELVNIPNPTLPQFRGTVIVGNAAMVTDSKGDPIIRGVVVSGLDEKHVKNIRVVDEEIVMYVLRRIFESSFNRECLRMLVDSTFRDFHKRSYILAEHRQGDTRSDVWLSNIGK